MKKKCFMQTSNVEHRYILLREKIDLLNLESMPELAALNDSTIDLDVESSDH